MQGEQVYDFLFKLNWFWLFTTEVVLVPATTAHHVSAAVGALAIVYCGVLATIAFEYVYSQSR